VESRAGWHFDVESLGRLVSPRTRLVVANFPHNPTGALPTADEFDALVKLAAQNGAWMLSDEMYRGLEYDEADHLPAAVDRYPQALSLGGVSKGLALAGLRIGWLATHDGEALSAVAAMKDYTTICSAAPSEWLAIMALRARAEILARNRAIIAGNCRHAQLAAAHPGALAAGGRPGRGSETLWSGAAAIRPTCAPTVGAGGGMALPGRLWYGRAAPGVGWAA
jgi:aspartate/methionine/tyrosine aminotransferase